MGLNEMGKALVVTLQRSVIGLGFRGRAVHRPRLEGCKQRHHWTVEKWKECFME